MRHRKRKPAGANIEITPPGAPGRTFLIHAPSAKEAIAADGVPRVGELRPMGDEVCVKVRAGGHLVGIWNVKAAYAPIGSKHAAEALDNASRVEGGA